jgi:hypothetical protein
MRFWAVDFCGLGRIGIFIVDNIVDQVIEMYLNTTATILIRLHEI